MPNLRSAVMAFGCVMALMGCGSRALTEVPSPSGERVGQVNRPVEASANSPRSKVQVQARTPKKAQKQAQTSAQAAAQRRQRTRLPQGTGTPPHARPERAATEARARRTASANHAQPERERAALAKQATVGATLPASKTNDEPSRTKRTARNRSAKPMAAALGTSTGSTANTMANTAVSRTAAQRSPPIATKGRAVQTASSRIVTSSLSAQDWTQDKLASIYQTYNPHGMGFELSLHPDGSMAILVPNEGSYLHYEGHWDVTDNRITLNYTAEGKAKQLVYVVRESLKPADPSWMPSCRGSLGLMPISAVSRGSPGDYYLWPRAAVQAGQAPCPR